MRIDSADLTNEERDEACEWVDAAGCNHRDVKAEFTVEPALPGSVKLTFELWVKDADRKWIMVGGEPITEPFTIYATERLGWLQRYLERTGTTLR